jgi:hypothetical protein
VKRHELKQTLRAAGRIARELEFFLIGSQAVHAYRRKLPAEVLLSQECDLYPKNHPEAANLIENELGRRSKFARRHGYYADVVTPEIASLPAGWQRRLKPFRAGPVTALCLEAHDLVVSKLAAGRLKDLEFVGALVQMKLADPKKVRTRMRQLPMHVEKSLLRARLQSVLDDLQHGLRD